MTSCGACLKEGDFQLARDVGGRGDLVVPGVGRHEAPRVVKHHLLQRLQAQALHERALHLHGMCHTRTSVWDQNFKSSTMHRPPARCCESVDSHHIPDNRSERPVIRNCWSDYTLTSGSVPSHPNQLHKRQQSVAYMQAMVSAAEQACYRQWLPGCLRL